MGDAQQTSESVTERKRRTNLVNHPPVEWCNAADPDRDWVCVLVKGHNGGHYFGPSYDHPSFGERISYVYGGST